MLVVVALRPRRVRWRTIFKCGTLVAPRGQGALCQPRVHSQDTSLGQQHATRIMKVCHGCQGLVGRSSAASQHKHRFVFGPPGAAVGGTPPRRLLIGASGFGASGSTTRQPRSRDLSGSATTTTLSAVASHPPGAHRYRRMSAAC
jgi:hypothetical protein